MGGGIKAFLDVYQIRPEDSVCPGHFFIDFPRFSWLLMLESLLRTSGERCFAPYAATSRIPWVGIWTEKWMSIFRMYLVVGTSMLKLHSYTVPTIMASHQQEGE